MASPIILPSDVGVDSNFIAYLKNTSWWNLVQDVFSGGGITPEQVHDIAVNTAPNGATPQYIQQTEKIITGDANKNGSGVAGVSTLIDDATAALEKTVSDLLPNVPGLPDAQTLAYIVMGIVVIIIVFLAIDLLD